MGESMKITENNIIAMDKEEEYPYDSNEFEVEE